MADVSKTVDIIFNGTDKVSDTIKTVSGKLDSFSTSVTTVTSPLASLTKGILAVDAALVALAGAGLVKAFQASSEFATATAGLKKVMGDNAEALKTAQNAATSLSEKYGVSAANVLSSTTNFVQAGYNVSESMKLAANSLDLVIAGDLGADEASKLLVATLKGFDAPASDATRLIDGLNEVSNNYATDVRELATGMSVLAPIASQMGMSFEETMGVLTPVIEIFQSGDEAATALKTGLLKLIDDSAPVKEALAKLGVSQTDLNGKLRSGKDILKDVAIAFQSADEKDKLFLTSQLVGIEQSAKMVTVFDNLGKTTKITATALNSAGSAAKEVAAMLETPEAAVNRLREGFTNLNREIGDKFKGAATEAINGGTSIEQALRDMVKDGTFDPIFDKIKSFASKLGSDLETIAQNLPEAFEGVDFSGLLDAFDGLGDALKEAFKAFFGDLDLTKPEDLRKALQEIVDTGETLARTTKGLVESFTPLLEKLGDLKDKINDANPKTKELGGSFLGWGTQLNFVANHSTAVSAFLLTLAGSSMVNATANIASLANKFSLLGTGVGGAAAIAGGAIGALIGTLCDKFAPEMVTVGETVEDFTRMLLGMKSIAEEKAEANLELCVEMTGYKGDVRELLADMENIKAMAEPHTMSVDVEWYEQPEVAAAIAEIQDDWAVTATVEPEADEQKIAEVKEVVEATIPAEKIMEISAQVKVAEIEASKEIMLGMLDSVQTAVTSTGETISSLWDTLGGGDLNRLQQLDLEGQLKDENRRRQEAFELNKQLIEQQIEMNEIKLEQMANGEGGLITINCEGLEPVLEMLLWEIMKKVQMRANESAADFLKGI